ncbi:MAG: hypothetical protein HUU34_16255 [Saprospiraceae bacterium]|nr:hypothetical protein [Saprospiraceae bacterium]
MVNFDILVSGFDHSKATNPTDVNLKTWLTSPHLAKLMQPYLDALRSMEDATEKSEFKREYLPMITPSGLFSKRGEEYLIQHSGFIQIDIDFKDNTHIENYSVLRWELAAIANIAYAGLSASGSGYWCLVPIAYPEHHKRHFEALQADFLKIGIHIDPAPKNVSSARFYSWDPNFWINHNAVPYTKLAPEPVKRETKTEYSATDSTQRPGDQFNEAHNIIDLLENYGWKVIRERDGVASMNRPGAKTNGKDATAFKDSNSVYVYSSSAGLPLETPLTPFALYTYLEHNGDFKKASQALRTP